MLGRDLRALGILTQMGELASKHRGTGHLYVETRSRWNTNIRRLAEALQALAGSGRLRIEDPAAAAEQFTWLVIGAPLNARMLGGDGSATGVDAAVDLFLAGYRANA